jgi:hypothetical protein
MSGLIGLGSSLFYSFLPLYLNSRFSTASSVSLTYRNYVIISIMGIPGSLAACLMVDWTWKVNRAADHEEATEKQEPKPHRVSQNWNAWHGLMVLGGRKVTLALSTLLTGVFLFLFTTSKSPADVLGYSCASSFTQYVVYYFKGRQFAHYHCF